MKYGQSRRSLLVYHSTLQSYGEHFIKFSFHWEVSPLALESLVTFHWKEISKLKVWLRFQNTNPINLICKIEVLKVNIVGHPFNNTSHIFINTHHTTLFYKTLVSFMLLIYYVSMEKIERWKWKIFN